MKKCTQEVVDSFHKRVESFISSFEQRMALSVAYKMDKATQMDNFRALAYAVRDEVIVKWLKTQNRYYTENPKRVYYFSLEFLIGRTLGNSLINLNLDKVVRKSLSQLGYSLEELEEVELEAGLGNGGLGRLAACFLDSMATMDLPAYGYGIRYEYGMFRQAIEKLQQQEYPDNWLRYENPWDIARTEFEYEVHFGGKINTFKDCRGSYCSKWVDTDTIVAIGYDFPVPGYQTETVNTLKLWSARSSKEFNLQTFNAGDYIGAIMDKNQSETISKVLYPNDNNYKGKELRLKQQYFMVSASLQDILHRLKKCGDDLHSLPEKAAIQLNDTHPSIAIPELMRILLDDHGFAWDDAWHITVRTFAYTNHTVLPEALEKWPVSLLESVLPRHVQLIYEINQRFLDVVSATFPGDFDRRARMSIIEEADQKYVRMPNLAIIGSHHINGVAALHTDLLKSSIFKDFYELWPEKFISITNGVTPRRWLKMGNPDLSNLISSKIGEGWTRDLSEIKKLEAFSKDATFLKQWEEIKRSNKKVLAEIIQQRCPGLQVNLASLFDVQVKRMHEYKRQILNLLHVITLYNRIKDGKIENFVPRTVIFGGKAAPGYQTAKDIIHLINSVANIINRDRSVGALLKVAFIPNYCVSLAEKIFPGSDLSEQISTAGMEASGTGNMKFSLNGALTIGTLDGANIEIMEEVGEDNIFIFGKTVEELDALRRNGYNPRHYYETNRELHRALDQIRDGFFSPNQPDLFSHIFNHLVEDGDHFFVLADYADYIQCQEKVSALFRDRSKWYQQAVLNVARMGKFSSDRAIQQYAKEIWGVTPC